MARFTLPRDLYHGKGALENLKNLQGKRAISEGGLGKGAPDGKSLPAESRKTYISIRR